MPIENLAYDILNAKCHPDVENLGDLGLHSGTDISMLSLQIEEDYGVVLDTAELTAQTKLCEIRKLFEAGQLTHSWSRGSRTETIPFPCMPYAGLMPTFSRPSLRG